MRRTAKLAAQHGIAIGAHPGFPDAKDFGRQDRQTSPDDVESLVSMQLRTLVNVLALDHLTLTHVKPHGALYHLTARDRAAADAIARAVAAFNPRLLLFALAGSTLVTSARSGGLTVVQEAFADRAYRSDGTLVPRTESGALLQADQQVRCQLREILNGYVTSTDGQKVSLHADSLCIHTDTPCAVELAGLIRGEIESAGGRIARVDNA
jgi:UPF0271 protein